MLAMSSSVCAKILGTPFTKNIAATGDDVSEHVGVGLVTDPGGGATQVFGDGTSSLGYLIHGGFRFTDITVPKDSLILSATITLNQAKHAANNSTPTGTWAAWAQDNAAAFSGGNTPASVTKTTATKPFTAASSGTKSLIAHDVATIVQEIVNRAGWTSGNAINFTLVSGTPGNIALDIWDDFQTTGAVLAKLDVLYA